MPRSLIDELRAKVGLGPIDELRAKVGLDTEDGVRKQIADAERRAAASEEDAWMKAVVASAKAKLRYMLEDTPAQRIDMLRVHADACRRVIAGACANAGGCPRPGTPAAKVIDEETKSIVAAEAECLELERTIELLATKES